MNKENIIIGTDSPIHLKNLLYFILHRWRMLLKGAILLAVVLAALSAISNVSVLYNEDKFLAAQREYEIALSTYETTGETLQLDIQNLHATLQQQRDYNENSLLMQIDPYNKYIATFVYYVDTGYQIIPEYVYQDVDYGPRLVQMYTAYMTGGEMYDNISESLSEKIDVRFVEELFTVKPYNSTGMIEVQLCATSMQRCREIIDIVSRGMEEKHADASAQIGEHTLTKLSEYIYSTVDTELDQIQKDNILSVTNTTAALDEKTAEYRAWKGDTAPSFKYSTEEIIKSAIKAAIIGGFVGAFLLIAVYACQYLFGDRVQGALEFRDRIALAVLGEIPATTCRKNALDRKIDQISNAKLHSSDYNAHVAAAAENICWLTESDTASPKAVALVGSMDFTEMQDLCDLFQNSVGERMHFVAAGNPLTTVSAADTVRKADFLVFAVRQNHTTYTDILDEYRLLATWNKKVLGIVFIQAGH